MVKIGNITLNKNQTSCLGVCCFILLLLSLILILSSIRYLNPTEAGINFNTATGKIVNDKVYTAGRHFIGLGHKFIKFPTNYLIIDFNVESFDGEPPLDASSRDGQAIEIEVTLYYSLIVDEIQELYASMGLMYHRNFYSKVKVSLKNIATEFYTVEFFQNRTDIENRMIEALNEDLNPNHAHVNLILLRRVQIPPNFEQELINKVVAAQEIKTREYVNTVRQIEADTLLLIAQADRNITEQYAQANADGQLLVETAKADATALVIDSRRTSYANFQNTLNVTDNQLMEYIWHTKKIKNSDDTLVIGLDNAIVGL